MNRFPYSERSSNLLRRIHPHLREVFYELANCMNTTILPSTVRTVDQQAEFFREGKSTTMNSLHLPQCDGYIYAVDAAPYPINWDLNDRHNAKRWFYWRGLIDGIANQLSYEIRGGHDWDNDNIFNDQKFNDIVHTELVKND